jgi:hypothetical protein
MVCRKNPTDIPMTRATSKSQRKQIRSDLKNLTRIMEKKSRHPRKGKAHHNIVKQAAREQSAMKGFLRNNGLSLVLAILFVLFFGGQAASG